MSDAVEVAIITSIFTTIAVVITTLPAMLTSARRNRRSIERVRDTVGDRNGEGDLATMMSRVLATQAEHELADRRQFLADAQQIDALRALLEDRTPMFSGLKDELMELNRYSRKRNHNIIGGLTVLAGWVQMAWNEIHPNEPLDFEELERALNAEREVSNPPT